MTIHMVWFIIALIVLVITGVGAFLAEGAAKIVTAVVGIIVFGFLIFLSTFYVQDVGQAKVIKSFDGSIVRESLSAGGGFHAPWEEAVDFDITGQQAIYKGDGKATAPGEKVAGPEISFQDNEKVSGNADVAVRYSIKPDSVAAIYTTYKTQENFVARLIDQDIRSIVRNVPANYSTADVLVKRAEIEQKITDGLKSRWEKQGVIVDSVALQGIRYPQSVQDQFAAAQNARTQVASEQAKLDATKISAQQQVVQAQAQAEANRTLAASLTPEILQQQQLDTLKQLGDKGNVFVVPNGSNPLIQVDKK